MKAFVIKNKEGKYYKRYFDAGYVEFVDNFCFAELYTKKEGADDTKDFILRNKYRFNIENLEVVEITIAETKHLEQDINKSLEQQLAEKDKEIEELKNYIYSYNNEHNMKFKVGDTVVNLNVHWIGIIKEIEKWGSDDTYLVHYDNGLDYWEEEKSLIKQIKE